MVILSFNSFDLPFIINLNLFLLFSTNFFPKILIFPLFFSFSNSYNIVNSFKLSFKILNFIFLIKKEFSCI